MRADREKLARVEERITALERLIDIRFTHVGALIDAQSEKVVIALTSADRAVTKAEVATEKRFESVNEFRQTLTDQASTFVSRASHDQEMVSFNEKLNDVKSRLDKTEGRGVGLNSGWVYLLGLISAIGIVVAIVFK